MRAGTGAHTTLAGHDEVVASKDLTLAVTLGPETSKKKEKKQKTKAKKRRSSSKDDDDDDDEYYNDEYKDGEDEEFIIVGTFRLEPRTAGTTGGGGASRA